MRREVLLGGIAAAFAMMIMIPAKADAATALPGSVSKEKAQEIRLTEEYYGERYEDEVDHWYKFKTGNQEGIYLFSYSLETECLANDRSYARVVVEDQYGTVKGSGRGEGLTSDEARTRVLPAFKRSRYADAVAPITNLSANTYYYISLYGHDGSSVVERDKADHLYVEFIPFKAADGFKVAYNKKGDLVFSWNNIQSYNTYSTLASFDSFTLHIADSGIGKYIGNGGTNQYILSKDDSTLKAAGYPEKSVKFDLNCTQTYHSHFNELKKASAGLLAKQPVYSRVLKKGKVFTVSGRNYKITKAKTDGTGEVQLTGLAAGTGKSTKMTVGKTVKIQGFTYKITGIGDGAFKNNKVLKELTLGANIKSIGKNAFYGCKKLKTVTIRSKSLKKVGKNAFKGMSSKGVIKVPSGKAKSYEKLLKGKYTKGVRIA